MLRGMENYELEKRIYPHTQSPEVIKMQAQKWGISVGYSNAEAFTIIRTIQ
jgi:hypothetical protein